MRTERSASVLLSILLLTSLITPLLISITITSVGTVKAATDHVVISEVFYDESSTYSSTIKITISNPYKNYANWYKVNLHCHTENSDGHNTADEMIAAYRASGYSVVAITDHNYITNSEAFTDLPFFLGINAEEDGPANVHIVALDITTPINEGQSISKRVADIIGQGGIASVAHPGLTWPLDDVKQAVEAGARLMEIQGDAKTRGYWDNLLSENKLVYGIMADDAHSTSDIGGGGWAMVNADSLSKSSILQNLKEGNSYCVQSSGPGVGPEIYNITVENENVIVISAAGDYVTFIGDRGTLLDNKVLIGGKAPYSPTVGLSYVRMEVHSEGGIAYTQPLWVDELPAPSLISPENNVELVDNTPTFEWTSVSGLIGVTYQIQIDDDIDFSSPVYFAVGLVENTHTLPDENALALGMYFWRVRVADNEGKVSPWSSVLTLFICTENRWTQVDWKGGPTKPSLQVGTWDNRYDNFYDSENINWSANVKLESYQMPISGIANHVVISEFATRGFGGYADEFIELYNPTDNPISIEGWDLKYFTPATGWAITIVTLPPNATIPAYSFYLIANPTGYSPPSSGPPADYSTSFSLADGSTTAQRGIRLRDASGAVIDTVVYGGAGNYAQPEAEGGRTAPGAPTPPQSVERKAQSTSTAASMAAGGVDENSGNGYDSGNNYNDWVKQDSRNPQNSSGPPEYPMTSRFRAAGFFESSIYDAGDVADWKFISWIENKPTGTSIIVRVRTGNDDNPFDGGWSAWHEHGNGEENVSMPDGRYAQYRIELSTTDSTKTPELLKVTLNYEVIGYRVEVETSPGYRDGLPGGVVTFDVVVTNRGALVDNYTLSATDDLGWTMTFDDDRILNLEPNESETRKLTVTIPGDAADSTMDNIVITATSDGDENMYDSIRVTVHAGRRLRPPVADAYVAEGLPDNNFGGETYLNIWSSPAYPENMNIYWNKRVFPKFDLSRGIPADASIEQARLRLYNFEGYNADMDVEVYAVGDDSWLENEITWNNQPTLGNKLGTATLKVGENSMWYEWDITSFVLSGFTTGDNIVSLCLKAVEENSPDDARFRFESKEWDNDNLHPYLWITLTSDSAGVSASVSPGENSGLPGVTLSYTVTVTNTGNVEDIIRLSVTDNAGWGPTVSPISLTVPAGGSENAALSITIPENATGCTSDNVTVNATSQADNTVSDNDSCIAHVQVVRGVEVLIEPDDQPGVIGENVVFTVTVKNTGNVWDNYNLTPSDDAGWTLKLDNDYLEIPENENRETKLTVTIPDNENLVCTTDNMTVVATAVDNTEVTGNDNATVHAVFWEGTVAFSLVNLYTVNVEKILDLNLGSKLVVKFYTYGDAFENENVIETFVPPAHVEENELARHPGPGRVGVKKARLDLTTDDTNNVISTIASFTVTKTMLELRFTQIPLEWALAGTPEEKTELEIEFSEIPLYWALAPA